jgi:hypothetical protein
LDRSHIVHLMVSAEVERPQPRRASGRGDRDLSVHPVIGRTEANGEALEGGVSTDRCQLVREVPCLAISQLHCSVAEMRSISDGQLGRRHRERLATTNDQLSNLRFCANTEVNVHPGRTEASLPHEFRDDDDWSGQLRASLNGDDDGTWRMEIVEGIEVAASGRAKRLEVACSFAVRHREPTDTVGDDDAARKPIDEGDHTRWRLRQLRQE